MNSQRNLFTTRRVIALVLLAGVVAYCVSAQTQQQLCPGCYKDQEPFPGRYGARSSTDPRRVLKIKIGPSWNVDQNGNGTNGTNPTVFNALDDSRSDSATSLWNNARDGSTTTSVYFQLDQVADPDIIIKLGENPEGGCAHTDTNKRPYVITLSPGARNWTPAQIALIVAHELGHTIGLGHARKQANEKYAPDCPTSDAIKSVMQGYKGACQPVATRIEPTDIEAHNKQYQSRLVFCRVSQKGGYATIPDEGDPGGNPCENCNPQPPSCFTNSTIYISSDGLGCYHIVYQEETYCDGLFVSYTTYAWDICTTGYPNL